MSKEARQSGRPFSDEVRKKIAELAALVSSEQYGPEGPPLETTFSEIEAIGHELGRFAAVMVDKHLQEAHASHFESEEPCPQCGRNCEVEQKDRTLQTLDGDMICSEPCCYCNTCERFFFSAKGHS